MAIRKRFSIKYRLIWLGIIPTIVIVMMGYLYSYFHAQNIKKALQIQASENSMQRNFIIAPAIIDSMNDITKIPALQSGVIKKIQVKLGQTVKKGDLLFELEHKIINNTLSIQKITLQQSEQAWLIQQQQLNYLQQRLRALESLDARAISRLEINDKRQEIKIAQAKLQQAENDKRLAECNLKQTQLSLKQFKIYSPKAGIVLQINAHRNEYLNQGQPIIYLGDARQVIVRVSIDEREAYRFQKNAPAHLINYANANENIPLKFMQMDQYIVVQERLNSRVQEALYRFERKNHANLIAGQLFDVYIDLPNS